MAETKFSSIEGKSPGYRWLLLALALLALAGLASFVASYIQGHELLGSSNAVPWGMPIVFLIYLIGLSAGSLILSSLTYVFGREEYKPIARLAVYLAIVLIFGAMVFIFVDLGRPEKFWRLFMFFYLNNMKSMFAINGVLYGGYFLISLSYLGFIFFDRPRMTRAVGTLAVGWAMLVHMGTGAIFGFVAARETWFSAVRPLEFLTAALTSGMALLIVAVVVTMHFTRRMVRRETIVSLGRMLSAFIIVLLVLVFLDKLTHLYPPHREAAQYMLAGQFSGIFWIFQIGMGAVIPLIILFHPTWRQSVRWVTLAGLSVVIGVFFERYYLVIPGAAYPLKLAAGEIEGIWGATISFPITPVETLLSLGIIAILGLLFLFGLKYLELLPVTRKPAPAAAPAAPEEAKPAEAPPAAEAAAEEKAPETPPAETAALEEKPAEAAPDAEKTESDEPGNTDDKG
ncbi:MAG: NrfD/PsrC family molybdoenzyme membrane anchor subunit [Chloroflexota bacterium]